MTISFPKHTQYLIYRIGFFEFVSFALPIPLSVFFLIEQNWFSFVLNLVIGLLFLRSSLLTHQIFLQCITIESQKIYLRVIKWNSIALDRTFELEDIILEVMPNLTRRFPEKKLILSGEGLNYEFKQGTYWKEKHFEEIQRVLSDNSK
jgi:hypothetical protein